MADQVRPNFGAQPKGKPNIVLQGWTEADAWGADPGAKGAIPEPRDMGKLGKGA
jgi:hypothetical protein